MCDPCCRFCSLLLGVFFTEHLWRTALSSTVDASPSIWICVRLLCWLSKSVNKRYDSRICHRRLCRVVSDFTLPESYPNRLCLNRDAHDCRTPSNGQILYLHSYS